MGEAAAERVRGMTRDDFVGYAVPAFTLGCGLAAWEGLVRLFRHPALSSAGAERHHRDAVHGLADAVELALGDALDHAQGAVRGGHRQRGAGGDFRPVAAGRTRVLSLCGRHAGDADRRDRAAAADLSDADGRRAGLRVPGGVLSAARQHHARPVVGGPQSRRPFLHVPRVALSAVQAAAAAVRAALFPGGPCASAAASR